MGTEVRAGHSGPPMNALSRAIQSHDCTPVSRHQDLPADPSHRANHRAQRHRAWSSSQPRRLEDTKTSQRHKGAEEPCRLLTPARSRPQGGRDRWIGQPRRMRASAPVVRSNVLHSQRVQASPLPSSENQGHIHRQNRRATGASPVRRLTAAEARFRRRRASRRETAIPDRRQFCRSGSLEPIKQAPTPLRLCAFALNSRAVRLRDSFVSWRLRGCDVGSWLCAFSVSLWFARCDGSGSIWVICGLPAMRIENCARERIMPE